MNRFFLKICLLQCFLFLFTACKKDDVFPSTTSDKQDIKENYIPLEIGYKWTYVTKSSDTLVQEIMQSKTLKDQVYQEIKTTSLYDNSHIIRYLRNNGTNYDQFWVTDTIKNDGFFITILVNEPHDHQKWSYTLFYETLNKNYISYIQKSNNSHTVDDVTFNNVMIIETTVTLSPDYEKVSDDFESNYNGSILEKIQNKEPNILLYTYTSYYAKNIGLVEQTSTIDSYNVKLVDYNFK